MASIARVQITQHGRGAVHVVAGKFYGDSTQQKRKMQSRLQSLRFKYETFGKGDWWWLMDDSLEAIVERLREDYYVVVDGFLGDGLTSELREEIKGHHDNGRLTRGILGGGRTGDNVSYTHDKVRALGVRCNSVHRIPPRVLQARLPAQ